MHYFYTCQVTTKCWARGWLLTECIRVTATPTLLQVNVNVNVKAGQGQSQSWRGWYLIECIHLTASQWEWLVHWFIVATGWETCSSSKVTQHCEKSHDNWQEMTRKEKPNPSAVRNMIAGSRWRSERIGKSYIWFVSSTKERLIGFIFRVEMVSLFHVLHSMLSFVCSFVCCCL